MQKDLKPVSEWTWWDFIAFDESVLPSPLSRVGKYRVFLANFEANIKRGLDAGVFRYNSTGRADLHKKGLSEAYIAITIFSALYLESLSDDERLRFMSLN